LSTPFLKVVILKLFRIFCTELASPVKKYFELSDNSDMELTGKDGDKFSEYSDRARMAGKVGIF